MILSVLIWMLTDTGTVLDLQSRQSYCKHAANDSNCFPRDITCPQTSLMAFVPSSQKHQLYIGTHISLCSNSCFLNFSLTHLCQLKT